MRFSRVRSGLHETSHEVIAHATDGDGTILFSSGDVDRPLFYRSAIKPFQALAARRAGLELVDEHLAVSCSSHSAFPVHLAIVESILDDAGLTTAALQCPASFPHAGEAARIQLALGHTEKERRFDICSGKHAAWLAACTTAGWSTNTYLEPDHPLQQSIYGILSEMTGMDPMPTGIDGCGAPTLRGSVTGLTRAFARLANDRELARIANAMTRFGALLSDNLSPQGRVALNWGGPAKIGAEGLFAMSRRDISIVTKSVDGSSEIAVAAATVLADTLGALPNGTSAWLANTAAPPVLGGGVPVGSLELEHL